MIEMNSVRTYPEQQGGGPYLQLGQDEVDDLLENGVGDDAVVADGGPPFPDAAAQEAPCEMKLLLRFSVPVLVGALSQAVLPLTSFVYTRANDAAAEGGIALGVSVCNVTGVCIYYGMATGIETLSANAFGARQNRLIGVAFARGMLLTTFTFVPVAFLWYNMERILLVIPGPESAVAHVTGSFCRSSLWGMVPYAVFENLKRCLQAQNVVVPEMIVAVAGVFANIVFHHVTMVVYKMGVYGAGLALSLTGVFMLLMLVGSIIFFRLGVEGCWSGIFSREIFEGWREYLVLCIPGLTAVFIEWASFETTAFMAALVSKEDLAAQGVLLSAYSIVFTAALSISIAATVRVGNLLGAGDAPGARRAAHSAFHLALGIALFFALGLYLGREIWPIPYRTIDAVTNKIICLAPIYAVVQTLDMVQVACTGVLKGMGLQRTQAIAATITFCGVAVPLMAYLSRFCKWGLMGIWSGMAIAEGPLLVFYLYTLYSADWTEYEERTRRRMDEN